LVSGPGIIDSHPLAEEILDAHAACAQGDAAGYAGYRGHVYRVLNFARALVPGDGERDDKLAIAAAFHDLEAFSSLTTSRRRSARRTPGCDRPDGRRGQTSSRS
jgi:hypothetical protein